MHLGEPFRASYAPPTAVPLRPVIFRAASLTKSGLHCRDLDEVAAGVVEDGRGHGTHVGGSLRERHAECAEPIELGLDIVDGKGRGPIGRPREGFSGAALP